MKSILSCTGQIQRHVAAIALVPLNVLDTEEKGMPQEPGVVRHPASTTAARLYGEMLQPVKSMMSLWMRAYAVESGQQPGLHTFSGPKLTDPVERTI